MDIPGYTYIQHHFTSRPWGIECQFTAARADGSHINEVTIVESASIPESELAEKIAAICQRVDAAAVIPTEAVEITNQDGSVSTFEVPL